MSRAWHAAACQDFCGSKQKASKKCSIPSRAKNICPAAPNHVKVRSSRWTPLMMEVESADLVFLCFVCFWREWTATVFALEENQFRFCLDCVALCLEESLLEFSKA